MVPGQNVCPTISISVFAELTDRRWLRCWIWKESVHLPLRHVLREYRKRLMCSLRLEKVNSRRMRRYVLRGFCSQGFRHVVMDPRRKAYRLIHCCSPIASMNAFLFRRTLEAEECNSFPDQRHSHRQSVSANADDSVYVVRT